MSVGLYACSLNSHTVTLCRNLSSNQNNQPEFCKSELLINLLCPINCSRSFKVIQGQGKEFSKSLRFNTKCKKTTWRSTFVTFQFPDFGDFYAWEHFWIILSVARFLCDRRAHCKHACRRQYQPMNLESFNAGTVTLRVSKARNAPNSSNNPAPYRPALVPDDRRRSHGWGTRE